MFSRKNFNNKFSVKSKNSQNIDKAGTVKGNLQKPMIQKLNPEEHVDLKHKENSDKFWANRSLRKKQSTEDNITISK